MKIGIGITTRNRHDVLGECLERINEFRPPDSRVVVVDDASAIDPYPICSMYDVDYYRRPTRHGIAKNKNLCLQVLHGCDYIFLLDDDCFPVKEGWSDLYIKAHKDTGVNHFIYTHKAVSPLQDTLKVNNWTLERYKHPAGVMMFLTKEVLEKVGAYNPNYGVYGHEHVGYSTRCDRAGLNAGYGPFLHLSEAQDYICALDIETQLNGSRRDALNINQKGKYKDIEFISSIYGENAYNYVRQGDHIFEQDKSGPIYIPLKDSWDLR